MIYQNFLKSQYTNLTLEQVLDGHPSVLLGVSTDIENALKDLGIETVFDLGMSSAFDTAARILAASEDPRSTMRRYGRAPSSFVQPGELTIETAELPYESIAALAAVDAPLAAKLTMLLSVVTVRDLALWPPYLTAKALVLDAYNPTLRVGDDPELPAALVPKSGEFGTERFLYSNVVMFPGKLPQKPQKLDGLFDISDVHGLGFDSMRFGAKLTWAHTWYPVRVAKGHLLHSLPLAPGESTNVAVIDWASKSAASTQQSMSESERLQNTNDRARTISQIASSVANELTTGSSVTATESTSTSGGVGGVLGFVTGVTAGASANEDVATTHTVSTGERDVATRLQQHIQDTTQQVATSMRSERAAVISEVSQSQSENLSTRSVTNFNHMHALTVQYYEVVQIYETELRLHDAEQCIFIPMRLIDFTDVRNILKYLSILEAAALDGATRQLLGELEDGGADGYELHFHQNQRVIPTPGWPPFGLGGIFGQQIPRPSDVYAAALASGYRILDRNAFIVFGGDVDDIHLNTQLQLDSVDWDGGALIRSVDVVKTDGTIINLAAAQAAGIDPALGADGLSFGEIRSLVLHTNPGFVAPPTGPFLPVTPIRLDLWVTLGTERQKLDCSFMCDPTVAYEGRPLYDIAPPPGVLELGEMLNENQLYYSRRVWLGENPQNRIMELAPFTFKLNGQTLRLVDLISPVPLQVVGNYLVYRFTYEENPEWVAFKQTTDRAQVVMDQVPLPTGGVFAEAVPGRANAAEKLDATRFFDWQESPPPVPPGITPLQAGTHAATAAPQVGTFDTAVVGLQAPVAFPNPVSLSALFTALTTSDMFRNMAQAGVTATAASDALDAASGSSIESLTLAGSALASSLKSLTSAISSATSDKGLSTLGALVNQATKQATATGGGGSPKSGGGGASGGGGGGAQTLLASYVPSTSDLVSAGLANLDLGGGSGNGGGGDGSIPLGIETIPSDVALLSSPLITEPTFSDVTGFVFLLQLLDDSDIISVMIRRFDSLGAGVNALGKYGELVGEITNRSAQLENPARFLYAAEFVKTGVLPVDGKYDAAQVSRVRDRAVELATLFAYQVAKQTNPATGSDVVQAMLTTASTQSEVDINHIAYMLATAHHESRMGALMTESPNGISTDTVFTADAYFFNPLAGIKSSYNGINGNKLAGDQLKANGTINAAADVALWNGTAYPDAQPLAVKKAARKCDFYVYIGRGLVQLTGRDNYRKFSNLPELGNRDFEANPQDVADLAVASTILLEGMENGMFRGNHKLADYDLAAGFDAVNARDIVNGDKATWGARIRDLAKQYKTAMVQFPALDESKPIN